MSEETNYPADDNQEEVNNGQTNNSKTIPLSGLYENWFWTMHLMLF